MLPPAHLSSVYHTERRLHTVPLLVERQAGKLRIPIFIVFGLARPGIEPVSTTSVADALSPKICHLLQFCYNFSLLMMEKVYSTVNNLNSAEGVQDKNTWDIVSKN